MDTPFNFNLPIRTVGGFPARLLTAIDRVDYRFVVAIMNPHSNKEEVHFYDGSGQNSVSDLTSMAANGDMSRLENISRPVETHCIVRKDELVNVTVRNMIPLAVGANPFHHDDFSMGTTLVNGWTVMHPGSSRDEDPRGLHWVYLYNSKSGQRVKLMFTPKLTVHTAATWWNEETEKAHATDSEADDS